MKNNNKRYKDNLSKWEEIFSKELVDWKKTVWIIITVVSFITLIVITIVQILYMKDTDSVKIQVVSGIFNYLLIPVTTAILSAAFLNIVYVTYENRQLSDIKNFEYKELAQNFFEVLEKANGKKRRNEHIDVTLSPFKKEGTINPQLIKIRISYEFEANTLKDTIFFMFERNNNGDITPYISSSNSDLENYEFYWANDETGTFPASEVTDDDYIIEQISINSLPVQQSKITHEFQDCAGGKIILYKADISEMIKDQKTEDEFYNMALTVSFPMETESILFITHEYPTKSSEMSVNYSEIKDSTTVYTMPMTGPIPVNDQKISDPAREQYRYDGWLIPKTGYVISWWKK